MAAANGIHLTTAAYVDVALLGLGGAVAFFFIFRFLIARRAASLAIAWLIPTGWGVVALIDLGLLEPRPDGWRVIGVVGLCALLGLVLRSEWQERKK